MHWTDGFSSTGPIDKLVGAATDPVSGQPELKATPIRVKPIAPLWRGLLLHGSEQPPQGSHYWARVPLPQGHAFDLAGWEPLPSGRGTEIWVSELLGAPAEAEWIIYADPRRGAFRYASLVDGRLDACLFLARTVAALPPRELLATLLGTEISPEHRMHLLTGRPSGEAVVPNEGGRTVCACFGVGLQTLHRTIIARRLTTVAEIGVALRAGTNCGSCIPEINALLHETRLGSTAAA